MSKPLHILVFGVGGVGGYYGGQLARHYASDPGIRISFVARGAHLQQIQNSGLVVESTRGTFTAFPDAVSENAVELGPVDLVLLAVKSYDLETAAEALSPVLQDHTWILPLMNGVDNTERISALLPGRRVLDGLVYLVAFLNSPGRITQRGIYDQIQFGSRSYAYEAGLDQVEKLLQQAHIQASYAPDIQDRLWEKYLLISAVGSVSSFTGLCIGALRESEAARIYLEGMLQEGAALASAKGIRLAPDIVAQTLEKVNQFEYEATSSMQRDFAQQKPTEVEALTGYVAKQSRLHGLSSPVSEAIFAYLSEIKS